ncbi:selenocysteine-specific translation elongation factor [Morganella morganii]|uniref:selenocysteine-specific translation elongation factor n=1 Tax=Morganella morganii TaxID=582 RepID=UPI0032D9D52B
MIFATAGHVDHGKTALIQAVTGVDTTHLPEEKKRGMTIDLGYAYWPQDDDTVIGFVDVPGHEKFLGNMLAGIGGIRHILLIIACDDGVMAQTREHLAILRLAGRPQISVVLTKADRVPAERVEEVRQQITELLLSDGWPESPVFVTSSHTGEGLDALRAHLRLHHQQQSSDSRTEKRFRMAIDRVFSVKGAGLVVTGTALAGRVSTGDTLWVTGSDKSVRVRGIHAQNRQQEQAQAGDRVAINLSGDVSKETVSRGDWLLSEKPVQSAHRILAEIETDEGLKSWQPVHIHHGASHITGRVSLLSDDNTRPLLAEITLDTPLWLAEEDRLILRDISAQRTLAGARVLNLSSPRRGKRRPEFLAWLSERAAAQDDRDVLMCELPRGEVSLPVFAWARQLTAEKLTECTAGLNLLINDGYALSAQRVETAKAILLATLADYHQSHSDQMGVGRDRLKRMALPVLSDSIVFPVIAQLLDEKQIVRTRGWLHLPGFGLAFDPAQGALWHSAEPLFQQEPWWVRDLAVKLGIDETAARQFLKKAAQLGHIMAIVPDRYYHRSQITEFAQVIREYNQSHEEGIGAAQFRDKYGMGRKLAVQILEFFDRTGFTRRRGDKHILRDEGLF